MNFNTLTKLFVAGGIMASLVSCQKEDSNEATQKIPVNTSFKYETSINSDVVITAPSYLANATFELYTADPKYGGKLLAQSKLDFSGNFNGKYVLPSSIKSLYLKSTYIGLNDTEIEIENGSFDFNYIELMSRSSKRSSLSGTNSTSGSHTYNYLGSFNGAGVPNYLTTPDLIDASILGSINDALPETESVPVSNPHYLNEINESELKLVSAADVWITFIHEGAGAKNTFGFYTYDSSNPPQSVDEIDEINIVLPNASASGSGGGLVAGDKVYLGNFPANTSIGWVLLQNSWNGSGVDVNKKKFYSNPDFNPENSAAKRQHYVQLVDEARQYIVVGIEDVNRDATSDEDFNDLIFYVSVDPWASVNTTKIPDVGGNNDDEDGDGVPDYADEYPTDPDKAFNNYLPFQGGFTSYAFEDLWPNRGDYDFNDLIVNANYNHITNAQNEVTEMVYSLKVEHIGASYANGFGIQWPFAPSQIKSISGIDYTYGNNAPNGTELGQSKAVMIAYPNTFDARNKDVMEVTIEMDAPYELSTLLSQNLNAFIYVDQQREKEVHLMDYEPTDLASPTIGFGKVHDVSEPAQGLYYRSDTGQPWGISISHAYKAPKEKVDIWWGYLKFNDWVSSGGTQFTDWYEDQPGYRNNTYIQN